MKGKDILLTFYTERDHQNGLEMPASDRNKSTLLTSVTLNIKGTVRLKTRWFKSGINSYFFLYCLAADIFNFDLKGQYSLKSIKLVSAFNNHSNKLCKINVASAANSLNR